MIKFKDWNCYIKYETYPNGRTAIVLYEIGSNDPSPVTIATVNIPDFKLDPDVVVINDYSENEGALKSLIDSGIVSEPIDFITYGFVTLPVCKLLKK